MIKVRVMIKDKNLHSCLASILGHLKCARRALETEDNEVLEASLTEIKGVVDDLKDYLPAQMAASLESLEQDDEETDEQDEIQDIADKMDGDSLDDADADADDLK